MEFYSHYLKHFALFANTLWERRVSPKRLSEDIARRAGLTLKSDPKRYTATHQRSALLSTLTRKRLGAIDSLALFG